MRRNTISVLVLFTMVFVMGAMFAFADEPGTTVHNSTVTISPDSAHCGDIPNEFTVHVTNLGPDNIFEVRIFSDLTGITDFDCGPAPAGWDLALFYDGYCEYKTNRSSAYVIQENESLDFTFDATLNQDSCITQFQIGTLDEGRPGDIRYHYPELLIDCSDPVLLKHVGDPKILIDPACNPNTTTCDYWITQDTEILVEAYDSVEDDECNLGIDYCEWQYTLDGNPQGWNTEENGPSLEWQIQYNEDSEHYLEIFCYDMAGNMVNLTELEKVDTTPPVTTKTYVGPQKMTPESEWIDGVTNITLTAIDGGEICHIDGVETYYQYHWYPERDYFCEAAENCDTWQASSYEDEDWVLYEGPINSGNESCHVIEFYSADAIGNREEVQHQCVFVDKSAPEISKEVVEPYAGDCPPAPNSSDMCYVTSESYVDLICNDVLPHPSGGEMIYWRYTFSEDGENFSNGGANCTGELVDGWCKVPADTRVQFVESSMHQLEWFCMDAVEKTSETDVEIFYVDNDAPVITKEVIGPQEGQCPPAPNSNDTCYIKGGETIIQVTVDDGDSIHASDNAWCQWDYYWNDDWNGGGKFQEGEEVNITFYEDSQHDLRIYCEDRVGNSVEDVETFLVDMLPPETWKWYGEPYYQGGFPKICDVEDNVGPDANSIILCGWAQWITSNTPVYLNASDEKVGVDKTYWRNLLVEDDEAGEYICGHMPFDDAFAGPNTQDTACATNDINCNFDYCNPEFYSQYVDLETNWTEYTGPFYKPEDSCHIIEYYSVDLLGNEERLNWQCVFVDNQHPEMTKELGEPHVQYCENVPNATGPVVTAVESAESYFFTLQDVIFFGYTDGTYIELFNSADVMIWNGTLNRGDMETVNVAEGIYRSDGTEKYSVLVGAPISQGCAGFYALDDEGLGASTDIFSHTSNMVCQRKFVVFSYDDNNNYDVRNVVTNVSLSNGMLNDGERWEASSIGGQQVHVTSDFPVTVLTVDDQGYFIPGADGLFSGQFFYTYVHSGGYMDLNAYAYYDNTTVTFTNTDTNAVIATQVLDKGESLSWTANANTYVTVTSDKDITASVQPFISRSTAYHEGSYAGDRDGSGIGLEFMVPAWTGSDGYVWVFAYADDTHIDVYNGGTGALLSSHDLDKGDAVNVQQGHLIHQIVATKGVSVYTGWGEWSASFTPVAFGENACLDADGDGICDPVDNCPDDYNPNQEDICSEGEEVCVDYITTQTPITFSCMDTQPHPVDHVEMYYRYRFSDDCESWDNWTEFMTPENLEWSEDRYTVNATVYFQEDSCHELEYYCVDGLGNMGPIMEETDIVDTVEPDIDVVFEGPTMGVCPAGENETCYIDWATTLRVTAIDPEPHPVNDVMCEWRYDVYEFDGEEEVLIFESNVTSEEGMFDIKFPEESHHYLYINCWDALGNSEEYETDFYVDHTAPQTWKEIGEPKFFEDGAEWITMETPVTLNASDEFGPHDTGVSATYYRWRMVNDSYCENQDICQDVPDSDMQFTEYDGTFTVAEESCHVIEYYSVDGVGKVEDLQHNCVYVDDTPPTPTKTVGQPRTEWDWDIYGDQFYNVSDRCWNGENDSIDCWKVTLLTPIDMSCEDPQPHPVDHENVCFMVGVDGNDYTEDYCENYEGDMTEEGYCCVEQELSEFYFMETTYHNLKYYCEDALGNRGPVDDEKFKVEETKFEIQINQKWNLISTPVNLLDDSMDAVFMPHNNTVYSVWSYDAFNDEWHAYTPDGDAGNDFIDAMEPGYGYWLFATDDDMLVIGGNLFNPAATPNQVELKGQAWNLIGYYGADGLEGYYGPQGLGKEATCALDSLGAQDAVSWPLLGYWEPYNPFMWQEYVGYDRLDPGAGYWVFPREDSVYKYSVCDDI